MNRCIYTKTEFELADGEHILQNFLGARWVSKTIACNDIQGKFGKTIDMSLERSLQEIRNLLGTKGGRGGEGPTLKNIQGSEGNKYHLLPRGIPQIAAPIVTSSRLPDGRHLVQIKLGSAQQYGWALAILKERFPDTDFDLQELIDHSASETGPIGEGLHLQAGLGGHDFFRGSLKSIFNLLGAMSGKIALLGCFDDVRSFICDGEGLSHAFARWINNETTLKIPKCGEFDHFIAVYSHDKGVYGFAQYFGEICFSYRLANNYMGDEFQYGYLVNPFRDTDPAERRNPPYQIHNLPKFVECSSAPDDAIQKIYSKRLFRFLKKYYEKSDKENISHIIENVLLPHDGEVISEELAEKLINELALYIHSRLKQN